MPDSFVNRWSRAIRAMPLRSAGETQAPLSLAEGPSAEHKPAAETFQGRVRHHLDEVTAGDPTDVDERRDRFGEEALELIQALGGSREGMLALVDYVWGRPAGAPAQEMGGALTTLAALASHADLDMAACGEAELARTWTPDVFARIRRKRAARGGRGALPGVDGDVVTGGSDA